MSNILTAILTIRESVPGSSLIFGLLRFWPTAISVASFRTYGLEYIFLYSLTSKSGKHASYKILTYSFHICMYFRWNRTHNTLINNMGCNNTFVRFSSSADGAAGAVGVLLFSSLVRSRDGHLQHLMSKICLPISSPVTLWKNKQN